MYNNLQNDVAPPRLDSWKALAHAKIRQYSSLIWVVIMPTLLVAIYFGIIAARQYSSETHFIVRQTGDNRSDVGSIGQMLSAAGGITAAQAEALSVGDYLSSHDAVAALRSEGLIARFRRPEADLLSRLWSDQPTSEGLLRYYRRHVEVRFNSDTGITTLQVRAFRPADALALTRALLRLGEKRVNDLNARMRDNTLSVARQQLADAERGVALAQARITRFRQSGRDIDPAGTGEAQTALVSNLRQQLAEARAQSASVAAAVAPSSPQRVALERRVQSLQAQVSREDARLAGGAGTIATGLGDYEELKLRQEFAGKRYEAAAAAMERAREQTLKQQLFVVRVVDPNLPEKSLYPERLKIIGTVFFCLLLLYAIGWLIAAGVKEHAA